MFLIHFNIICKTEPLRSGGCKITWGGCGGGRLLYLKCFLGTGRDFTRISKCFWPKTAQISKCSGIMREFHAHFAPKTHESQNVCFSALMSQIRSEAGGWVARYYIYNMNARART